MSVWIAGATIAVGGYSAIQAGKQGDKAVDAQDRATAAGTVNQEEQLDFAYEQYDEQLARYDEWRAIYGPIEENLSEFYNNLTPDTFAAAGLEANASSFQKQKTQTLETLEQRGLGTSGITAAVENQSGLSKATADAKVRRDAPFKVAEAKTSFLSQGKGGPTLPPTGDVGNVMANDQVPGLLQGEANRATSAANSLWGSAGNMLSTGVNYLAKNQAPSAASGTVKTDYNPTNTPYMRADYG